MKKIQISSPESSPSPKGGKSLLDAWLERGWIQLVDGADYDALDEALEALVGQPVAVVVKQICALPDVEDLYASDDELEEFLEQW